ncbi:hypothetical protein Enr13x_09280 [Stieleria neptunia]|uniref:Uncharacterized protein n=1 Tax=Stieleria neptunia TaxID=2527979 RepID=A0A518HJZ8_9BACT|nr:hypothetical protein Enr13x_09280 [Stieleria neptunia]
MTCTGERLAWSYQWKIVRPFPVMSNVPRKDRDDSRRRFVLTDLLDRLPERVALSVGACIVELRATDGFARLIDAA